MTLTTRQRFTREPRYTRGQRLTDALLLSLTAIAMLACVACKQEPEATIDQRAPGPAAPSPLEGEGAASAAGEGSKQTHRSETGATSDPTPPYTFITITLSGYDAGGEPIELVFDFHPLAIADMFPTGPGDTNHDGVVDLDDMNLVLTFFGTEYTEEPPTQGEAP